MCWAGWPGGACRGEEVGWRLIDSVAPGLIPAGPWLQFHGDLCILPPQTWLLARNERGVQAFSIGRHLAVQFHPEVDGAQLRAWLDSGGREEAGRAREGAGELLAQTIAEGPAARERAARLVASAILIAQSANF